MPDTIPDSHRDLLADPTVGLLTTNGPTGYPQTTPIWFVLDGEVLRTSLHRSRQKYRNLVRDARATLFVLDPTNPFRAIEVRGDVTIASADDTTFLEGLLEHYGTTLASFQAPADDRIVITLTPRRVVTLG